MKKIFICVLLSVLVVPCFAQRAMKALRVGDAMPDYTFPSVIQYPKATFNINDLKGKIVVLDFWYTGCTSCIGFFPDLQKLQDHFGDKIQIILVNSLAGDNQQRINKTLANVKKAWGYTINLPVALYDSILLNYFPHLAEPYEIVIDASGQILASTYSNEITESNIQALLDGKNVSFAVRDDYWNQNVPLAAYLNRENTDGILISSSLMKYRRLPGDGASSGPRYNNKGERIGCRDIFPLIEAYKMAYPQLFAINLPIRYETMDSVFNVTNQNWESKNFIYDWFIQPCNDNKAVAESHLKCLQQDLDRCFNFSLRRSKKLLPCLVAKVNKRISRSYTIRRSYEENDKNIDSYITATRNGVAVYAHKETIESILSSLNQQFFKTDKIIDQSATKQLLDIDFPVGFDFSNKEKLTAFLHDKGIDLSVENRELDCVVVSDKKPGEPTVTN